MSGLFVGRLDYVSGIGILREALALFPGARVDVIGTAPRRIGPSELQSRMRAAAYLVLPVSRTRKRRSS